MAKIVGWFSRQQAEYEGKEYLYLSEDGKTVTVTETTRRHEYTPKWEDRVKVGFVTSYIGWSVVEKTPVAKKTPPATMPEETPSPSNPSTPKKSAVLPKKPETDAPPEKPAVSPKKPETDAPPKKPETDAPPKKPETAASPEKPAVSPKKPETVTAPPKKPETVTAPPEKPETATAPPEKPAVSPKKPETAAPPKKPETVTAPPKKGVLGDRSLQHTLDRIDNLNPNEDVDMQELLKLTLLDSSDDDEDLNVLAKTHSHATKPEILSEETGTKLEESLDALIDGLDDI